MPKNFTCKRCGECCRPPRLYKADIERIKKAGYKGEEFIYTDNFENNYIKDKNGWCIFLRKSKKKTSCKIYSARPRICRLYPARLVGFAGGDCRPVELAFDRYFERKIK